MLHHPDIQALMDQGRLEDALAAADGLLKANPADASLITSKGLILWRMQRRGEAISQYERAAAIDPSGAGARFLANARDVMNYFNPDLLNP